LRRRARVIVLPRPPAFDAFIASVEGPRQVAVGDTVTLRVTYGTAGRRETGNGRRVTLSVFAQGRRLASREEVLPDSGALAAEVTFPVSRLPSPGLTVLQVALEDSVDSEPRDDARSFVLDVSRQPTA